MSGGDDRPARSTRRFDSAKLAALTRDAGVAEPAKPDKPAPRVPAQGTERPPVRARTATIEDPMTTAMLAEVARRAQTIDFDEKLIEQVVENLGEGDTAHPHTRRRKI